MKDSDSKNKSVAKAETIHAKYATNYAKAALSFGERAQSFAKDILSMNNQVLKIGNEYSGAISDSLNTLGSSVGQLQKMTIDAGLLNTIPKLNFIADPINTSLGLALESMEKQKSILTTTIGAFADQLSVSQNMLASLSSATATTTLNNLALDVLSETSIHAVTSPWHNSISSIFLPESKPEIEIMEKKLNGLKKEKEQKGLSVLTDKVKSLLSGISSDLSDKFKATCLVIFDKDNKDGIAQCAESMTRLIEDLPSLLSPNTIIGSEGAKKAACMRLTEYLSAETHNHDLILKQHLFYDIFSDIRHRRAKKYLENPLLFKALLIQTEAYIYELLTYNGIKDS